MKKNYLIKPYYVGKEKRSLAIVIPIEIVRSLALVPDESYIVLKLNENNEMVLKAVNDKD